MFMELCYEENISLEMNKTEKRESIIDIRGQRNISEQN